IVVMQSGSSLFGVVVDKVHDTEEIVVKPISTMLRQLNIYSGNTLLGGGGVVMILDPNGLAAHAGQAHEVKEGPQATKEKSREHRISFLLFRAGEGAQKAVPLSLVTRLESMDMEAVEQTDGRRVIQYHGHLMPLMPANDHFSIPGSGKMPVLVFSDHGNSLGVVVQEILDIVEEELQIQLSGSGQAHLGSAIIGGKATDIVDASYFLAEAFGNAFAKKEEDSSPAHARLLLVDDSAFFRNLLTPYLSVAGYDVTAVGTAAQALALCSNGAMFDAIVSDLEMPEMDGFQFAANLRAITRWAGTPLIALSSLSGPRDQERCRKAGFTGHVPKFDRDKLLATLTESLRPPMKGTA
ncbi:MAG: response regulator, partial [Proteobacteria bacterium]|nr:response regulator [Pseudomonadota bacterium]